MSVEVYTSWVEGFVSIAMAVLIGLVCLLIVVGIVNAFFVIFLTLRAREARAGDGGAVPLPTGVVSMYSYLHLLADVLLVVVALELVETFLAFLARADPKAYLGGVIGAALVALARRIIVFFNPEGTEPRTGEMYAYAALVAALAIVYGVVAIGL